MPILKKSKRSVGNVLIFHQVFLMESRRVSRGDPACYRLLRSAEPGARARREPRHCSPRRNTGDGSREGRVRGNFGGFPPQMRI